MNLLERSSAIIEGDYRYDLVREWDDAAGLALWVMLNPSTADDTEDDRTVRRVRSFTMRAGFGGFVIVNLYALRSPDPQALLDVDDPHGPRNIEVVARWLRSPSVQFLVAAWGAWGAHSKLPASPVSMHVRAAAQTYGLEPQCLGRTATGEPCHPLYLPGSTEFRPWP